MMKPIQATPELSDIDFAKVLNQTKSKPTAQAMKKNNMLHGVLINIRKNELFNRKWNFRDWR